MRSLELAGVIGTWAAVALALIALIGVIPIYIGYRRKVTTRAKEIAKVDDPNRDFITRSWPRILGQRFFSRVHVPDLLDPPNIHRIGIKRTNHPEFWPPDSQSRTGWVNFLNILRSYDALDLEQRSDGKLEMVDRELVLPIHRSWILLLGLVDRYSSRQDHGLLSGESREPLVGLRFDDRAVSGLSGVLSLEIFDQDEEQASPLDIICFHMHRLSQIRRLSSEITDGKYPLMTLLFLFLGYIPSSDAKLYVVDSPPDVDFSGSMHKWVWEFREVEKHMLPQHHGEIFEEFKIEVPKVHVLHSRELSYQDREVISGPAAKYYDIFIDGEPVLIRRTDANAVLRAVMELGCNSQSFLYVQNTTRPGLLFLVLGRKGLKVSITRALEALHDNNQQLLQDAMDKTLKALSEHRQPGSWSRSLWAQLSNLLTPLMGRYSREEHCYMLAISVLFSLDSDFRRFLQSLDSKPMGERKRNSLTLDFASKVIRFPDSAGTGGSRFSFDFAEYFRGSSVISSTTDGYHAPKDVRYVDVAIACLYGHIIMAMWSMCISAENLSDLYTNLEPTVYVSARTLPRRRRSLQDKDYSPGPDNTFGDEFGDWSGAQPGQVSTGSSRQGNKESSSQESTGSSIHEGTGSPDSYEPSLMQADSDRRFRYGTPPPHDENLSEHEMMVLRKKPEGYEIWQRVGGGDFEDLIRSIRKNNKGRKNDVEDHEAETSGLQSSDRENERGQVEGNEEGNKDGIEEKRGKEKIDH